VVSTLGGVIYIDRTIHPEEKIKVRKSKLLLLFLLLLFFKIFALFGIDPKWLKLK